MPDTYDVLQERLARLEAGETLETCLVGLSEDEANLLKMAATLRAVEYPGRAADRVAAQRRQLLKLVSEGKRMASNPGQPSQRGWVLPAALAGGAALLVMCAAIFLVVAGAAFFRRSAQGPGVAQGPNAGAAEALKAPNAESAILNEARGIVEVQASGAWTKAQRGQVVKAGEHVRTGALSGVTLTFYDGSQARLGPNTEVSVDTLNAPKSGPRVVLLTQVVGETDHEVVASSDPGSRYEVSTPSGTGAAKGTKFHVLVTSTLFVRFDVDESAVAVTNLGVTVVVVAGQSTVIFSGQPPAEPVFRITGEGEVVSTGTTWNIAGRTFLTHENTIIVGNPQVGDWVSVSGRLLADGTRVADEIVLMRRPIENQFAFTGEVTAIGDREWTIAGRTVHMDSLTTIEAGIQVGDLVEVTGGITEEGEFWAAHIRLAEAEGFPFEFAGVVDNIADQTWTIAGLDVTVNEDTHIAEGLAVGDVVMVRGRILDDGTWVATSIEPVAEAEAEFQFTGTVQSMDPWTVSGISFETDDATEIDEDIQVGDRVEVEGRILDDGTWVASEIERVEAEQVLRFEFVGLVSSIDPWIVRGVLLTVDEDTVIKGDIAVGEMVKVRGVILSNGDWLVKEIKHTGLHLGQLGCLGISTVVRSIGANQIVLLNWQTLDLAQNVTVDGDIQVASVVIYQFCIDRAGRATVVHIIVLYQLDAVPVIVIGPDQNDCKDGPDHDQGKGNDCHHEDDDD